MRMVKRMAVRRPFVFWEGWSCGVGVKSSLPVRFRYNIPVLNGRLL